MSGGQRVRIKECDKESKTKPAPSKASNKALPLMNKIAVACAKLLNKVLSKSKVLEDKSRSEKLSPGCDDSKRALKTNMGGNTIRTNGEGFVLAENLTPEGKSTKRPIKINIGGNKAQPKRWKMMTKMRSRRHTLDWWKCYLDSCASYHTFLSASFSRTPKKMGLQWMGTATRGLYYSRRKAGTRIFKYGPTSKIL